MKWTKAQLAEFEHLVSESHSDIHVVRDVARDALDKFTERHGLQKCDAMYAHLERAHGITR
jgi:hypothetical protein